MKLPEPCYRLPLVKYFLKQVSELYQKVYLKVKDSVSSASHINITITDMWSSVEQDSYLSLTCHYITADFSKQVCLHAAPFNDHHT